MGYNTVIQFSNDASSQYGKHKDQTIKNIEAAMNNTHDKCLSFSVGNHCNPMSSLKSVHADTPQLIMNWGNSLVELGFNNDIDNDLIKVRKKFLEEAKRILKEEQRLISIIEGKVEISIIDIAYLSLNEIFSHGKYKIMRLKKEYENDEQNFVVLENNKGVFKGTKKEVVGFSNNQIKKKSKIKKD